MKIEAIYNTYYNINSISRPTFIPIYIPYSICSGSSNDGGLALKYIYATAGMVALLVTFEKYSFRVRFRLQLSKNILSINSKAYNTYNRQITHHNIESLQKKEYTISLNTNDLFHSNTTNIIGTASITDINVFKNDCENLNVHTSITYSNASLFRFDKYYEKSLYWKDIYQV